MTEVSGVALSTELVFGEARGVVPLSVSAADATRGDSSLIGASMSLFMVTSDNDYGGVDSLDYETLRILLITHNISSESSDNE